MSDPKEAPKGFLFGAWIATAITCLAFISLIGINIYRATQSQIEASPGLADALKNPPTSSNSVATINSQNTKGEIGECKGVKIAINNYPGDSIVKEKTNKYFLEAMGGTNYRCSNVCNNSGKSNDEFIKGLRANGQPINTVLNGSDFSNLVQQEPAKAGSTVIIESTKNQCQGPNSEEYSGLTDSDGKPVNIWKENTTVRDSQAAKQQEAVAPSLKEQAEAARAPEGSSSTKLQVSTSKKTSLEQARSKALNCVNVAETAKSELRKKNAAVAPKYVAQLSSLQTEIKLAVEQSKKLSRESDQIKLLSEGLAPSCISRVSKIKRSFNAYLLSQKVNEVIKKVVTQIPPASSAKPAQTQNTSTTVKKPTILQRARDWATSWIK